MVVMIVDTGKEVKKKYLNVAVRDSLIQGDLSPFRVTRQSVPSDPMSGRGEFIFRVNVLHVGGPVHNRKNYGQRTSNARNAFCLHRLFTRLGKDKIVQGASNIPHEMKLKKKKMERRHERRNDVGAMRMVVKDLFDRREKCTRFRCRSTSFGLSRWETGKKREGRGGGRFGSLCRDTHGDSRSQTVRVERGAKQESDWTWCLPSCDGARLGSRRTDVEGLNSFPH
ncbi:hypothetical protein RRG08_011421 [Elysia crispata]|uniref:Uncharacterized protein n=1 Tax=Elysia crispata TaxID=231223 RepID=A0AAE1AG15_9GAST|nr:hypothetical protein RRG08_011421 [Elysia crispata]